LCFVEVARVEDVGWSGKVVLVLLAIEAGAVKRVLGSSNQGGFSVVLSRCVPSRWVLSMVGAIKPNDVKVGAVKVGSKACQAVTRSRGSGKI
jgi:hypothetical protein